jgi:hypothetical protein
MNPVQSTEMLYIFQETYGDEGICKMRVSERLKRIEEGSKDVFDEAHCSYGACGSVVVKALCYKPEGCGFDSR